jgi:hypothetical protein
LHTGVPSSIFLDAFFCRLLGFPVEMREKPEQLTALLDYTEKRGTGKRTQNRL